MLIFILIIIISILLLRLRIRFVLDDSQKIVFLGLGYSGIEIDLQTKTGKIVIGGHSLRELKKKSKKIKPDKLKKKKQKPKKEKEPVAIFDILKIVPDCSAAFWRYSIAILKSVIVEELNGDISAGFDSPDITGKVFGYYQAAYYAVPAVVGRVNFQPDWTESRFDASVRGSIAIPLYKILYRSTVLFFSLPLRDISKITIGRKERSHDG